MTSWLARLGVAATGFGLLFLLFVAAYPLGLIHAYPEPPKESIEGPLGRHAAITDLRSLDRRADEPMQVYLPRLTMAVAFGMVHYWTSGDTWAPADARYTGVSVEDNYLLWLQGFSHAGFRDYEFMTPASAIGRGYGFCSQLSKIVYSILRDQGIDSLIYSTYTHTVIEADGSVLDPDYGVFIPHTIEWLEEHPDAASTYYRDFDDMMLLRQAYGQRWHTLGTAEDFDNVRKYEARFARLKWLPPLLSIAFGLTTLTASALLRWRQGARGLSPAT